MTNEIILVGNHKVCMLPPRANVLMQLVHMYRHYLFHGIGLRMMLDLHHVLVHEDNEKLFLQLEKNIESIHLTKFASSVLWVMKEVYHLDDRFLLLIEPNQEEGGVLIEGDYEREG